MRTFILRFGAAFLTFILGLAGNFLFNDLSSVVERWIETPEPVLVEPCANALATQLGAIPLARNCGLIVVRIRYDRSLKVNSEELGSLDDPSRLVARLNELFRGRVAARAYRTGFESDSDVPAEERIEKTVLITAPRWISYGEVSDLVDAISATGAKPIGLFREGPGYPLFIEQNRKASLEANALRR